MCRLVCIITILLISTIFIYAQDITPTPQPVLGMEGCNPPCWNGLVPGVTSSRDAIHIILELNDRDDEKPISWRGEIEPETLLVINGSYSFEQQRHIHIDRYNYWTNVTVDIVDGRVERIQISANQLITIVDVFEQLGRPDYIYYIETEASFYELIYIDELIRITVRPLPFALLSEECTLANYNNRRLVGNVTYFSERSAYDTNTPLPYPNNQTTEPQPPILAFPSSMTVYLVNPISLEQRLADNSDTLCNEAPLEMVEINSISDVLNQEGE